MRLDQEDQPPDGRTAGVASQYLLLVDADVERRLEATEPRSDRSRLRCRTARSRREYSPRSKSPRLIKSGTTLVPYSVMSAMSSRPSAASRSWSGVLGIAESMPLIENEIRASRTNSIWRSKIPASSLSKPMIMPHQTSMPASWMRWTFSSSVPPVRTFWYFLASRSDSSSGLSMPMKVAMKLAWTIRSISSASSARSIEASVKSVSG